MTKAANSSSYLNGQAGKGRVVLEANEFHSWYSGEIIPDL
jgi:hypothetical protein